MRHGATFIAGLLLVTSQTVKSEEPTSHCTVEEKIYLACSTGKKIISLCGTKAVTSEKGYLQYRFGPAGKPELIFPGEKTVPQQSFRYTNSTGTSMGMAELEFQSGQFTYTLYSEYVVRGPGDETQGVTVARNGKVSADVKCKKTTVDELSNLGSLGLPEKN